MRKSILITGCSSGIGYEVAHGLQQAGWRVFATCRQQKDVERLQTEGLESIRLDYSDETSIRIALAWVLEQTGGTLDALYNNGAFACPGATEDLPRAALREIFEVNVFGYHDLTRLVIPVMRAQGHGHIINCSSILGLVVAPWRGAYNTTKFALEGLTDTLRIEMQDTNIKVVLLEPGPVTSDIRKKSIPHFEKWVDWENSPRAQQYRDKLLPRLHAKKTGKDPFELPASAVTKKLLKILATTNPKPRYYITTATYIMGALKRALPSRALDWILSRG
jgi:NAD(P)-dependent dehydrogenase (short-subunit alcohol dehydrogenase family)